MFNNKKQLWFAWKYLSLWYQQQQGEKETAWAGSCDLLENIYLCGINNNPSSMQPHYLTLWFAWKYLSLWYQQQLTGRTRPLAICCDLLENIYLCGINNNLCMNWHSIRHVVICLKISIFVVSTTTQERRRNTVIMLWFAWKYLSLWYQQQQVRSWGLFCPRCDLLENIYLCGINNNSFFVICCLSKGYKAVEGNKNGATKRNPTSLKWDFCFLLRWFLMMFSPSFFLL